MEETGIKSPADKFPEFSERFSSQIVASADFRGDLEFEVNHKAVLEMARFLKMDLGFDFLIDLFGMDYSQFVPNPRGLAVIYIVYSSRLHKRMRLKAFPEEKTPRIQSLCEIFAAANWLEREVWDMFGIQFKDHPNLRRILCHGDFEGHPLRKSYPSDQYQRLKTAIDSAEM